jgi:hypothetical protein
VTITIEDRATINKDIEIEDRRLEDNRRFVNNIEEEYKESVTGSEHPKGNASTEGESDGAIN